MTIQKKKRQAIKGRYEDKNESIRQREISEKSNSKNYFSES